MKTYYTVVYPLDLRNNEYWMGEVNEAGVITDFSNIKLVDVIGSPRDDMMYYVAVEDDGHNVTVQVIQKYMVYGKAELIESIESLVAKGKMNTIDAANEIMAANRAVKPS